MQIGSPIPRPKPACYRQACFGLGIGEPICLLAVHRGSLVCQTFTYRGNGYFLCITFCGERNTLAEGETLVPADTSSGMVAYGNDTDTAVDVTAVCAEPQDGDEILRIKDGGKEYRYLEYWARSAYTGWVYYSDTGIQEVSGDVGTILPGEAFYYYRRP